MTGGGAGIAGSTVVTRNAEVTVGTEAAPETCNSPLGTPISALAYKRVKKKTGTRIRHGNMSYDMSPASFLHIPPLRPPSGVIPAKAGILTRITFYEGPAVVVNCAGIPSRHLSYAKCNELCVPKSLVRIMAMGNSRRPYPD